MTLSFTQVITSSNIWPSHSKQAQERFIDPSWLKQKLCLIIHGRPGSPLWFVQLDKHKGSLQGQEKTATADGKHQGEDGLRGLREEDQERCQIDFGCDKRDGDPEDQQGDGNGVRGAAQGAGAGEEHGEGGGDVAVRAVHGRYIPVHRRIVRQEGAGGHGPQRAAGHGRPRCAGGQVHEHVQRRERQLLHRHVIFAPDSTQRRHA